VTPPGVIATVDERPLFRTASDLEGSSPADAMFRARAKRRLCWLTRALARNANGRRGLTLA